MKTAKLWRLAFVMLAAISLASCNSDDNVERRLTTNQKERYAQNISANILVSISLSIRTRIART